jgi:short chain dehydrogenase
LVDKVAIVTGAASGQGESIARRFVAEGAKVILADINHQAGESLGKELGSSAVFCLLDVSRPAEWKLVVDKTLQRFGKVNVLINSAGVYVPNTLRETSVDEWTLHYSTNQLGVFLGMHAVMEPMIAVGGGVIINGLQFRATRCSRNVRLLLHQMGHTRNVKGGGGRLGGVQDSSQHCSSRNYRHADVPLGRSGTMCGLRQAGPIGPSLNRDVRLAGTAEVA